MEYKDGKYYDWEGNETGSPFDLCTDTEEINRRREVDSRDPLVQSCAKALQDVGRQMREKRKRLVKNTAAEKLKIKFKTYLLEHLEENVTIVLITENVMEAGTYFHVGEGEMEEADIIALIGREYPEQSTQLVYVFDEV